MSGKFVRASKFRHVFGEKAKKELQYENLKVTNNAWDCNIIKANGKYISCNWNASGGGAFAVIPVKETGKIPDKHPLFRGHTAAVLDTDFDPFDDQRIASASDDAKICIWNIPEDYSLHSKDDEVKDITEPVQILTGHSRKVGHVLFHPTAKDVLASSSMDRTVRIWNLETGKDVVVLKHPDMVTSMSFSYNGEYLATIAKDKTIRVWDLKSGEVVSEGLGHGGAKNQRIVWLGNSDRLVTTGFSRLSDRQIGVWDAFNLEKGDLGGFYTVDQSSGILMPFYDDSTKILYLAGKGDGNIRYFEFLNDELFELSEFNSTDAQRGFAMAPKRTVNVNENQIMKAYKTVNDRTIEPISFICPRRAEGFQDDIYPDAPSNQPSVTAEEWFAGDKTKGPILFNFQAVYDGTEPSFSPAKTSSPSPPAAAKKPETPIKVSKPSSPKVSSIPEPVKDVSPPAPVDEVLKSDHGVNKLLSKASNLDDLNEAENPAQDEAEWEIETPKKQEKFAPEPKQIKKEQVQVQEPANIPETPKQTLKDPVVDLKHESTPAPKEIVSSVSETPSKSTASVPEPTTGSSSSSPAKSMGLKQSVEKLSNLVLKLESTIDLLVKANLEKDEKLVELEKKIDSLLSK